MSLGLSPPSCFTFWGWLGFGLGSTSLVSRMGAGHWSLEKTTIAIPSTIPNVPFSSAP
jgi:hypothetical protein